MASLLPLLQVCSHRGQVYAHFGKLQPLPVATHEKVVSLLGQQATDYVEHVLSGCPTRAASRLEGECADQGAAAGRSAPKAHATPRGRRTVSGATDAPPLASARSAALDALSVRELCLRLNACEWAGQQFLALTSRLQLELPAVGKLPAIAGPVRRCEAACNQLLEYLQARRSQHASAKAMHKQRRTSKLVSCDLLRSHRTPRGPTRSRAVTLHAGEARLLRPRPSPRLSPIRALARASGGTARDGAAAARRARRVRHCRHRCAAPHAEVRPPRLHSASARTLGVGIRSSLER